MWQVMSMIRGNSVPNIALEEDKLLTKLSRIVCAAVNSIEIAQGPTGSLTSDQIRDLSALAQTAKNLRELRIGVNGDKETELKKTTTKDLARISARIIKSRANLSTRIEPTRAVDPSLVLSEADEVAVEMIGNEGDGVENLAAQLSGPK